MRPGLLLHDYERVLPGAFSHCHYHKTAMPMLTTNKQTGKTCSGVGSCDVGKVVCNTGCMPSTGVCCPGGGYCDAGYTCTSDNKCRAGTSTGGGGGGSSCDTGKVLCDTNYCIPTGGVCCGFGAGKYCDVSQPLSQQTKKQTNKQF